VIANASLRSRLALYDGTRLFFVICGRAKAIVNNFLQKIRT
jgi:hypothetical protein